MARERADLEAARGDGDPEAAERGLVGEQLVRPAVRVARVVACADLDAVDARPDDPIERFLERMIPEEDREHAELHGGLP